MHLCDIFNYFLLLKNYLQLLLFRSPIYKLFMGQQTQKVSIEEFQESPQNNKKKIFKNSFKSTGYYRQEECTLPNCNCPAKHAKISNLKVCKSCQGDGKYPNFKKRSAPQYEPQSSKLRLPRHAGFGGNHYEPLKIVNEQVPISYYNAWSLPVQPCYNEKVTESRAMTADEDESEPRHHVVPVRPEIKHPKPPIFTLDQEQQQESIIHQVPNFDDVDDRHRRQRFFMH